MLKIKWPTATTDTITATTTPEAARANHATCQQTTAGLELAQGASAAALNEVRPYSTVITYSHYRVLGSRQRRIAQAPSCSGTPCLGQRQQARYP